MDRKQIAMTLGEIARGGDGAGISMPSKIVELRRIGIMTRIEQVGEQTDPETGKRIGMIVRVTLYLSMGFTGYYEIGVDGPLQTKSLMTACAIMLNRLSAGVIA